MAVRAISLLCALIAAGTLAACDSSSNAAPQGTPAVNPTVVTLDDFGKPLAGILTAAARGHNQDLQILATGQQTFTLVHNLPTMGPLFDSRSCAACHFQPSLGGSAEFIQEVRVRSSGLVAQVFAIDNILRLGPQMQGGRRFSDPGSRRLRWDARSPRPDASSHPARRRRRRSPGLRRTCPFAIRSAPASPAAPTARLSGNRWRCTATAWLRPSRIRP